MNIPRFALILGIGTAAMLPLASCSQTDHARFQPPQRLEAPRAQSASRPASSTPASAPAKAPAVRTVCSEATSGLIKLAKTLPAEVTLGSEFVAELTLTANGCAANVIVRDTVPAGATYLRSEPPATVEDNHLVWKLGDLDAGQTLKPKVWLKADKEGQLVSCATVSADPRVCAGTFVGKPALSLDQTGPETAILGSEITFNLSVKNTGTAMARGVVVTAPVPAGLSHASGKTELSFEVGDLAPAQSKPLAVTFKANQRGKLCATATATSANAGKASDEFCTLVLVPGLKVESSGPKEQILGRNADYEIVVSNTGDTTLSNVVLSDVAPNETAIVAAPGATLSGNKATWTLAELKPGAKVTQTLKLTSKVAGNYCNTVTVSAGGGLSETSKACTLWKGIAAVLLEVADDPDPIQVGENTTYTIKVTNQGFADIHNVKLTATFDDQVTPVSSQLGTVSGQKVTFPTTVTITSKQAATYQIVVKGVKAGDSRSKITLTCDELTSAVEESESTTVY